MLRLRAPLRGSDVGEVRGNSGQTKGLFSTCPRINNANIFFVRSLFFASRLGILLKPACATTEDKRSPAAHLTGMKSSIGMDPAGGGGGKRGDACLAEIQRLEKNRANRRNRMEKAR